jgi:hypothetical protein
MENLTDYQKKFIKECLLRESNRTDADSVRLGLTRNQLAVGSILYVLSVLGLGEFVDELQLSLGAKICKR